MKPRTIIGLLLAVFLLTGFGGGYPPGGSVSTGSLNVLVTTANVGTGLTITLPGNANSMQVLTMSSQSATITIPQGAFAGQFASLIICQNGTGTYVPTIAAGSGLTLVGTQPTFTTTASKCGDLGIQYSSTTNAYMTGSQAGPL